MEVNPLLALPNRPFDEPVLDIDREFMEINGPRKLLMFDTVKFSRSFMRWFNSQPYVCLLGLEVEACRVPGRDPSTIISRIVLNFTWNITL